MLNANPVHGARVAAVATRGGTLPKGHGADYCMPEREFVRRFKSD